MFSVASPSIDVWIIVTYCFLVILQIIFGYIQRSCLNQAAFVDLRYLSEKANYFYIVAIVETSLTEVFDRCRYNKTFKISTIFEASAAKICERRRKLQACQTYTILKTTNANRCDAGRELNM